MRVRLAACAGLLASIVLYAGLRVVAAIWGREANPATLLYSAHAGYFWRAWTAAYGGAMIAILAYIAARKDEARLLRVLEVALLPATVALVLQAMFVP